MFWLRSLFIEVVKVINPRLLLELGAADAGFSRSVAPLLRKAKVHALEANPYIYQKFSAEAQAVGVNYHNLAVGSQSGQALFKIATRRGGQSMGPAKTNNSILEGIGDASYRAVEVPMVSVDDFVAEQGLVGHACAAWIDVEGLAFEVLSGAAATLRNTKAILIELEDKTLWKGQHLAADVKDLLFRANFVPVARDFEFDSQYNMLFIEREVLGNVFLRQALENAFANTRERREGL